MSGCSGHVMSSATASHQLSCLQWRIWDVSKEGGGAVGVEGVWWRGLGPPQKKIILSPNARPVTCILTQILINRVKTPTVTRRLGTPILRFNRETFSI